MSTRARNIIGIAGLVLYILCVVASVAASNMSAVCAWLALIVTSVCLWLEENSLSEMEDALREQEADVTTLITLNEDLVEMNNRMLKQAFDILGDNRELLKHTQGLLDIITALQEGVDDYQVLNEKIKETGMKFMKDPVTGKWLLMIKQ